MKFNFILLLILLSSCTINSTRLENRAPYNSKGFAYIFNVQDFKNGIIKGYLDNSKLEVSHQDLKPNTLVQITNPKTKDTITLRNKKKIKIPEFYKILITSRVSNKLNLDSNLPLVDILEIKKNKSFVAKKAKIFNEEKRISTNAPVDSVEIANISKIKQLKKKTQNDEIYILIATFYSKDTASFLKKRIIKEIPKYDTKKLLIKKKSNKEIKLISGPYTTINLMKNDYILLKQLGFEELNISINE